MHHATYVPPSPHRAVAACAGSPLIVLAVFIALVLGWADLELAAAWLLGATIWVGWEMHDHQRRLDAYNLLYVSTHLDGVPTHELQAWADSLTANDDTREFLLAYLAAGRRWQPDRPRL